MTTLEIGLWVLAAVGFLSACLTWKVRVGHRAIFVALCVPPCAALLSLAWTLDVVSTVKMIVFGLTAVVGYLVVVNLSRRIPSILIADSMGLFVVAALTLGLLYWSQIPWVWRLFGFAYEGPLVLGVDASTDASAFSRLDHPYLGRSNDFATVMAVYIPFMLGVSQVTRKTRHSIIAFLAAVGVVLTFSRGVILSTGIVAAFVFASWLSVRRFFAVLMAGGLMFVVVSSFSAKVEETGIDVIYNRLNEFSGFAERFERITAAVQSIQESPMLGKGGGRFLGKLPEEVGSAVHNTYLEQWAAYGLPLGSIVNVALLSLAWPFLRWKARPGPVLTIARAAAGSVVLFLIVCTNQAVNEAAIPGLMFRMFIGGAVGYLLVLQRERDLIEQPRGPL